MNLLSLRAAAALAAASLMAASPVPAGATTPTCENFNNQQKDGWGPATIAPNVIVTLPAGGGPGGAADPYLRVKDDDGASLLEAGPAFRGNWNDLGCGSLCFDMKIFVDSDLSGSQNIAPYVIVTSGTLRARWLANTTITEPGGANPGWHNFCVPLGPLCGGQLPANSQGQWAMLDGAPVSSFPTLMSNVTNVYFPVDYGGIPVEETGYDNICLTSVLCSCDCVGASRLRVWRETVLCKPGPGNLFTYSFLLTNLSGQSIDTVTIIPPQGVTVTPATVAGPIPTGTNKAVILTISGATSGQQVCFEFKGFNRSGQLAGCGRHCVTMPACPCVQIRDETMNCTQYSSTGQPYYQFWFDNLSAGPITDYFVIPTPSTAAITPQWRHFNSPLPLYASAGPNTVKFTNMSPGQTVCLRIVFVNNSAGGDICCSVERCVTIPNCNPLPCCPGNCCPGLVCCVHSALMEMDGVAVALEHKTVTGSVGSAAWIEETDRSAGLLLYTDEPLQPGDVVDVAGEMTTDGYNRMLLVQSIQRVVGEPGATPVRPLLMNNQTIGGEDPNEFTFGVTGGTGLFNVGLLVQTWGKVTASGADYFYIDDGSGLTDPTGNVGVRVFTEGLTNPAVGEFLTVTGLVSAALYEPNGDSLRVLVPRSQADIGGATPGLLVSGARGLEPSSFTRVR